MTTPIRIFIFLILLQGSFKAVAQENYDFAGFRYGYSLPMGQFASHEYNHGAYALLGSTFSAEGAWYFHPRFGTGINISVGYYPIAVGYYLADLDSNDLFGGNFRMKSGPYQVSTYMLGSYYRFPVTKRWHASFKGLAGLCLAKSPDQLYVAEYFGQPGNFSWFKTSARSIRASFQLGASINYKLFDHVELLLSSEFTYAESKFSFYTNGGTSKYNQFMKMPLFKLQPGLNITF